MNFQTFQYCWDGHLGEGHQPVVVWHFWRALLIDISARFRFFLICSLKSHIILYFKSSRQWFLRFCHLGSRRQPSKVYSYTILHIWRYRLKTKEDMQASILLLQVQSAARNRRYSIYRWSLEGVDLHFFFFKLICRALIWQI